MNSATMTDPRNAAPAPARMRSPLVALLCKDLRLGAAVFVPSVLILTILAVFSAALPLFGEEFARSWGLPWMASRQDLPARIAYFERVYWMVAFLGGVLTALAIVIGDNGCRARFLLPALPMSSRLVYSSKLAASALVVTFFLAVALSVEVMSADASGIDREFVAAVLSIGVIWAFAAPLFARGFAAAFLVTVCVPIALFILCALAGRFLARIAIEELLVAMDAAPWYQDWESRGSGPGSLARGPIDLAAIVCACATVAAVGLWGAWNARGVTLCRRTPLGFPPARLLRFAGVALLTALVTTVGTAGRTWQTDKKIADSLATARVHAHLSTLPTAELVESFVRSRAQIAPVAPLPNGAISPVWDGVLRASDSYGFGRSPADKRFSRALSVVLRDRRDSDPNGLKDAMRSVLADTPGRTIGMQLAAARWIGDYTHTMVALRGLARPTDDNERAALILALCSNSHIFGPEQPRSTYEEFLSPDRPRPWGFVGWDLLPYRIRGFETDGYLRSVEARVSVVLLLASFERQLRNGTLRLQNEYRPDDRLEVDAATLRGARAAVEQPLGDLARGVGIIKPRGRDITRYTDDETLYLRTSELFDRDKTDPSYLLPEK